MSDRTQTRTRDVDFVRGNVGTRAFTLAEIEERHREPWLRPAVQLPPGCDTFYRTTKHKTQDTHLCGPVGLTACAQCELSTTSEPGGSVSSTRSNAAPVTGCVFPASCVCVCVCVCVRDPRPAAAADGGYQVPMAYGGNLTHMRAQNI